MQTFQRTDDAPTLIIVDSHIGYGAPHKQDTSAAHGEPLGEEEIRLAKRSYGWPEDAKFLVPDGVREHFEEGIGKRGRELREAWQQAVRRLPRQSIPSWPSRSSACSGASCPTAGTRTCRPSRPTPRAWPRASPRGKVLNAIAANYPWLIGGAADLAPSTKTQLTFEGAGDLRADNSGRPQHALRRPRARHGRDPERHGAVQGLRPYGAGFLIFTDYMKPPIRLAALMELPVIYVFTHDSIGVGEDGPTHQPIEQLLALRAIPGLITLRPGDANEVVEAWRVIIELTAPAGLPGAEPPALPTLDRTKYAPAAGVAAAPTFWPTRRRQARRDPDRHRQRGLALRRGL